MKKILAFFTAFTAFFAAFGALAFVLVSSPASADWGFGGGNEAMQRSASGSDYGRGGAMVSGSAAEGVVVNVRQVRIEASGTATNTGRALGATLGAVAGQTAGNGNGRIVTGLLGGLIGGIAGDQVASKVADATGQEMVVRLADGRMVVITQAGDEQFARGDRVYIIAMNGNMRVTRAM